MDNEKKKFVLEKSIFPTESIVGWRDVKLTSLNAVIWFHIMFDTVYIIYI